MPTIYCADKISPRLARTAEGFLVCQAVKICRTGWQQYRGEEVDSNLPPDLIVDVYRPAAEVLSDRFRASCEGKPVVSPHPSAFLTPDNASWFSRGHMQHIRRGDDTEDGEQTLIADLVITDSGLIQQIEDGSLRDCSLGYACRYARRDDGSWEQSDLYANHCAIVNRGRAGDQVRIEDSGEGVMNKEIREALDKAITLCTEVIKAQKLRQEAHAIEESGKRSEKLIKANLPVGKLHQALFEANAAYAEYCITQDAGQEFSDAMRLAGEQLGKKFVPKACADSAAPIRQHDEEEAWTDAMNRRGREMRAR